MDSGGPEQPVHLHITVCCFLINDSVILLADSKMRPWSQMVDPTGKRGYQINIFLFLHENVCCGSSLYPWVPTPYVFKEKEEKYQYFMTEKKCIWSYVLIRGCCPQKSQKDLFSHITHMLIKFGQQVYKIGSHNSLVAQLQIRGVSRWIFFLFLHRGIRFGYSSEVPQWAILKCPVSKSITLCKKIKENKGCLNSDEFLRNQP